MGATAHYYHATDDEFLKALDINPEKTPEFVSLSDFIETKDIYLGHVDRQLLKSSGFMDLKRYYTLEERLARHGLEIVCENRDRVCIGWDDDERVLIISDGRVLKEDRNQEEEAQKHRDKFYDEGSEFVFCYTKVNLLQN